MSKNEIDRQQDAVAKKDETQDSQQDASAKKERSQDRQEAEQSPEFLPPPHHPSGAYLPSSKNKRKFSWNTVLTLTLMGTIFVLFYLYWQATNERALQSEQLEQFERQQLKQSDELASWFAKVKNQQKTASRALLAKADEQTEHLKQFDITRKQMLEQIERLEKRLAQFSLRSPEDWLFYEANYLVQLAGFKLYLKRDFETALALLASADDRLLQLADPALIPLRAAISQDMATIDALPNIDFNGVSLALTSLIGQIEKMQVQSVVLAKAEEGTEHELTNSLGDWQQNLENSWINFRDNFVTIQRRNTEIEPLLSPNEKWFLYQNVKTKLLHAQIALYRVQPELYRTTLNQALVWIKKYFKDDAVRQFVIKELQRLQPLSIRVELPAELAAPKLFKRELHRISNPTQLQAPTPRAVKPSADEVAL